ncbi:hypothetical protein B484DRAFT_433406 [Ochromonadaceae sp. CCMP2298]|nr:hypothetical protein B484DRAFT_433406 [Ochromonadaceae sp. CCMP2298]
MVRSKINADLIYNELQSVDQIETGYESSVYALDIYDNDNWFEVAIGKQRTDNVESFNVIYFPIYLISRNNTIKSKIGIYELKKTNGKPDIFDVDGDLDLDKLGVPLIFSTLREEFVTRNGVAVEYSDEDILSDHNGDAVEDDLDEGSLSDHNGVVDEVILSDVMMNDKVFNKVVIAAVAPLLEETKNDAKKIMDDYEKSKNDNDNWVQNILKNSNFIIHENNGAGDCFFLAIRDAYKQKESNTQGQDMYTMRPSPFNMDGGIPSIPVNPVAVMDASRDNPEFNQNMFAGFDSHGQDIGVYTDLDVVHNSTQTQQLSDNPMDPNWGGVIHSQESVLSGKYADRIVGRPTMVPKVLS